MNKQNLLSFQYLIKYYLEYFIKTLLKCLLPLIFLFLGFTCYLNFLDSSIENLTSELSTIEQEKVKYEESKKLIDSFETTLNSNKDKLSYVQSLQGDFSKFDILMSYLINIKPYNLAFISIEDADIVPPPDQTADIVNKNTVSDILQGTNKNEINLSTKETEMPSNNETDVSNENVISNESESSWEKTKYDNSLTYTRDISLSNILIRGYGTDINAIASYVDSVSKAPEIEGYTLEGVENKITNVQNTNIILFEIKLKMQGVKISDK